MKSVKKTVEVILTRTHDHLGTEGDLVKVRTGYARNWLIPQGLALHANQAYKKIFEQSKAKRESRLSAEKQSHQLLADQIASKAIQFKVRVSETGKLYGSITNQTIAEELSKQVGKLVTKRKVILLQAIKEPGQYEAELRLYPGLSHKIKIEVIKEDLLSDSGAIEKQRGRRKKKIEDLVLDAGRVPVVDKKGEALPEVVATEAVALENAKLTKKRSSKKRSSEAVENSESVAAS